MLHWTPATDIDVTSQDFSTLRRYRARVPGVPGEAELIVRRTTGALVAAQTDVPRSMRDLGVVRALLSRMVADARSEGLRVVPACPIASDLCRQTPEWWDVATL